MAPEGPPDRLGQRLSAIDDEQAADSRVEAAADQIVQQRLDRLGGERSVTSNLIIKYK